MSARVRRMNGMLVALALMAAACGASPAAPVSGTLPAAGAQSASIDDAAPVDDSPSPSPTLPPIPSGLPADVEHAMSQRRAFGLRSDLEWVLAVAADSRSRIELLDFPMLPEEEQVFQAWQDRYQALVAVIQHYAAEHADEFGGLYIDQPGHAVVAQWTGRLDVHEAEIRRRSAADAPLRVELITWSERALRTLQDQVVRDWDWFKDIDAAPQGAGVDLAANVMEIEISSANPDAPRLIVEHYVARLGVPSGMLRVISDGTGVALMPRGTVRGTVVLADGSAPGENDLMIDGDGDGPGTCGGGDIGYGVAADGGFEIPCTVGGWTIKVLAGGPDSGGWRTVGRTHVVVPADGIAKARIVLAPGTDVGG